MKLVAMSRRDIEASDLSGQQSVAICIAYPNGRLHRVAPNGGLRAVHHVRFSDCDGEGRWSFPEGKDPNQAPPLPMTRGQAVDILDFVDTWRDEVGTIFCACYGGVSRSRGVLAGLAAVYGWDDREVYAGGSPNAWNKLLICRASRGTPRLEPTP